MVMSLLPVDSDASELESKASEHHRRVDGRLWEIERVSVHVVVDEVPAHRSRVRVEVDALNLAVRIVGVERRLPNGVDAASADRRPYDLVCTRIVDHAA